MISAELRDEVREHLRVQIATSDDALDELVDDVVEDFADEADDRTALAATVRDIAGEELAAHRAAQATWPAVTDCDRLDAAFRELDAAGIVARHGFTCCNTCGMAEIGGEVEPDRVEHVRGFAFYHQQDTEAAVQEGNLLLSYGAFYRGPPRPIPPRPPRSAVTSPPCCDATA